MIDAGIPQSGDDWPSGVRDALQEWEQGDCVVAPDLFYFADPEKPTWSVTQLFAESSIGPEVIVSPGSHTPPLGIVTSQTCDIGEEESRRPMRPWVQIAPVYPITDKGWKRKLNRGDGPRYWVPLPGIPEGFWIADLRLELPVEKGWLSQQNRIIAFETEEERRSFAGRLAWLRDRPAYSKEFNATVYSPLDAAMDALIAEETPGGSAAQEQLVEVCVRVDSQIRPSSAQLFVLTNAPCALELRNWFEDLRDQMRVAAVAAGIDLLALDVRTVDEVSAREYRQLSVLWRR